jgi:hypothetical protein
MKIIVQKCPEITALLMDGENHIIASETGRTALEAIGRLVTAHPDKFHLSKVTSKRRAIRLD